MAGPNTAGIPRVSGHACPSAGLLASIRAVATSLMLALTACSHSTTTASGSPAVAVLLRGGGSDPDFAQAISAADWDTYCEAFA